jgi:acetyl esterase/lipase
MTSSCTVEHDIPFGHTGPNGTGRPLHCDIYQPTGPRLGIGVLLVHGGGWREGSREMVIGQAEALAAQGFTCVACEYRLTPEAPWPAQLQDVKCAVRFMRASAGTLGIDPTRICALGNSAGAHLVLMLGGAPGNADYEGEGGHASESSAVSAIIAVYAPTVFRAGDARVSGSVPARALLGDALGSDEAAAAAISPITYVRADFPPTILLHGTGDKVVPVTASIRFHEALSAAGGKVDMHLYSEMPHGWARRPEWTGPTMAEAGVFLKRYVVAPAEWPAASA